MIPYSRQWLSYEEIKAVEEVLKRDYITTGKEVEDFETELAQECNANYAITFSSGTAALHAAMSLFITPTKNDILTTPNTFVATANAIRYNGGNVHFADIEKDTGNLDITKAKGDYDAILTVDFAGHPCNYDLIKERYPNTPIIEDASHAIGSHYKRKKVGSFADATIFSFHPVKHITAGEGGAVLTNNKEHYESLKRFRNHGIVRNENGARPWHYRIESLGYNYRLTDIQCAIGRVQLRKLALFIQTRRKIAEIYADQLPESIVKPVEKPYATHSYHLYNIKVKNRDEVYRRLRLRGVGAQVHYIPIYHHKIYPGYFPSDFPNCEYHYNHNLSIPLYPKMKDDDIMETIKFIKEVIPS